MKRFLNYTLLLALFCVPGMVFAEGQVLLSGTVFEATSGAPVSFGTVYVLEARVKGHTDGAGRFSVAIPEAGSYTILVKSAGLKDLRTSMTVNGRVNRDFYMQPERVRGAGITIIENLDRQNVSRHNMTAQELKDVPASFGDALNALSSLPGIIRTDGMFGPMVIRGATFEYNNYFIDGIPSFSPVHYGGLHSSFNNSFMDDIDLYASAFPARFGSATSAVISINSVDSVKEFGGYIDVGLISASALIQTPIIERSDGSLEMASPSYRPGVDDGESRGYVIISGRYGYLSLMAPYLIEKMTDNKIEMVPEYWDYQFKSKYYINRSNAITVMAFGSSDYFKILIKDLVDEGEDPLIKNFEFKQDQTCHGQGIYYTFQPSSRFRNTLMGFGSLMQYYMYLNLPENQNDWAHDIYMNNTPSVFGAKDYFRYEWLEKYAELRGGIEYTFYNFKAEGNTLVPNGIDNNFDFGKSDLFTKYHVDQTINNHVVGGYLENKFEYGWFKIIPGVRSDYLERSGKATFDPRGMAEITFPTKTSITGAVGKYSYFFQTNPWIFTSNPDVCAIGDALPPIEAIHRVLGIEQKFDLHSLRIEGFYNDYWNLPMGYPHYEADGEYLIGLASGKQHTQGVEVLLRKNRRENQNGLFYWASYTYTISRFKSGLPTTDGLYGDSRNTVGDPYGDTWYSYDHEQRHSVKLTGGYTWGKHTLSGRFQYYTSFPYTPINGSYLDTGYYAYSGKERHVPTYGERHSEHFKPHHTLDIRYSYKTTHSWGYVSWYVEVINVYNNKSESFDWDYRYAYSESNPKYLSNGEDGELGIFPNLGVEVKF